MEDLANTGFLFVETNKKSENYPDFTGRFNIDGVEGFRLAAWKRTSKNGSEYLSLKVEKLTQ